jgi:hypothetical protein
MLYTPATPAQRRSTCKGPCPPTPKSLRRDVCGNRLFFRRGRRCRLSFVRNRLANWVIAALVIFQLAIGLQWQTAQAVVAPPEREMNGMGAGDCPDHSSRDSRADQERSTGTPTSAPPSHHTPANKHDCCRSPGCQCHCAQSPGMLDLPRAGRDLSPALQQPILDARPPVTRSNELFRPPIA